MREWTETRREGTNTGPIDWTHEIAKDMPEHWREAEKNPDAFRYCENGGFHSKRIYAIAIEGYGLQDGLHRHRWDVCSAACGLKLLKGAISSIEGAR